jgi:hypothetical protein
MRLNSIVDTLEHSQQLKVFLCHSSGDKAVVRNLYGKLRDDGVNPWLDEEELLPGQDWNQEIRKAIRDSHIIIICLSRESIAKSGYVQKEIRRALDVAEEQPAGTIFLIPLKLEECGVPEQFSHLQWVNYFEEKGYERLIRALRSRARTLGISSSPSSEVKGAAKKPVSFNVGRLFLDKNRAITFGLTRDYNSDATEYWQLDFILSKVTYIDYRIQVELHVEVGKGKHNKAERLAKVGLNEEQINLLGGAIADRAKDLQSGTTKDTKIENLLRRLLDIVG